MKIAFHEEKKNRSKYWERETGKKNISLSEDIESKCPRCVFAHILCIAPL